MMPRQRAVNVPPEGEKWMENFFNRFVSGFTCVVEQHLARRNTKCSPFLDQLIKTRRIRSTNKLNATSIITTASNKNSVQVQFVKLEEYNN